MKVIKESIPTTKSSKNNNNDKQKRNELAKADEETNADDDDVDNDGSGGRVRPKFFCCGAMTKNQARASLNVMLQEQQEQLARWGFSLLTFFEFLSLYSFFLSLLFIIAYSEVPEVRRGV
jgi:hypothetical protein